jgi:dTMP kinase
MTLAVPPARPGAHGEPGILFVLEGIDRSGRSTHVRRLEEHLRYTGRGVTRTSLASSLLSGDLIRGAKRDRHADPTETALLYAADLAERVEQVVLPSLRAGLVVIADRYCWTPMARAEARGVDPGWLDGLFSFVPPPDAVLFLDVDAVASLDRRVDDPDPYEAGLDLGLSADLRESYRLFQDRLYRCFDRYAGPAGFTRIPAAAPIEPVAHRLLHAADAILARRAADAVAGAMTVPS